MIPSLTATVLLDPPTTLVAGAICALISWKLIKRGGLPEVWRTGVLSTAFSVLYALVVGWPFFFRADWMFVYLLDTSGLPLVPLYAVFFLILTLGGMVAGLGVGLMIHLGKTALAWVSAVSIIASLVFLQVITASQYAKVGTTQQYLAGTAPSLPDDKSLVMAVGAITAALVVGGVTLIVLQVRRTLQGSKAAA